MLQALGVVLLSLAVITLSIFLLGLGTLLKGGRCVLRRCGVEEPAGDACDGCPRAEQPEPHPPMDV
jgi:hypothetical protein